MTESNKNLHTVNSLDMVVATAYFDDVERIIWPESGERKRAVDPVLCQWVGNTSESARLDTVAKRDWTKWSSETRRQVLEDEYGTLVFKDIKGVPTLVILEEQTPAPDY